MGHGIKRKKIEPLAVDLDNDDACSEDAFIRKIASVATNANVPVENAPTTVTTPTNMNLNTIQLQVQTPSSSSLQPALRSQIVAPTPPAPTK